MTVVVRFAPSPTGPLHLGSARTALFNYLFAKKQGGKIYLRIEDTDRTRSKPEFEKDIIESLCWLGLTFDNSKPIRQSERGEIYKKYLDRLLVTNYAFRDGTVIRFKNPCTKVSFTDLIRGEIILDTTELGDFVIAKSFNEPLYHLAVVIDDLELGVTHIIRGEDHIANTPRQILLGEALSGQRPAYAHIPLILSSDRSKLSKRHGAVGVNEYRRLGYLKEALVNFLALLGWSPQATGLNQELFSLEELIQVFDLEAVQRSGAIFNQAKLNWFNHQYLVRVPFADLWPEVVAFLPGRYRDKKEIWQKLWSEIAPRLATLSELRQSVEAGEWDYFFDRPQPTKDLLRMIEYLPEVAKLLTMIPVEQFTAEAVKSAVWSLAAEKGRENVLWPLRVALTGKEKSPDPFFVAAVLGKEEVLARIAYAAHL